MNHIMLDLETLDTTPTAVVVSIGAVAFDPESGMLGDKFYVEMPDDTHAQQNAGRTISGDTVQWWMNQSAQARMLFNDTPVESVIRTSTLEALIRFARFVAANGDREVKLWGNGADFDNIILGSLYGDMDMKRPWSYSRNRCYRTMKWAVPKDAAPFKPYGVHHNALDDAIAQANHLMEIMAWLRRA